MSPIIAGIAIAGALGAFKSKSKITNNITKTTETIKNIITNITNEAINDISVNQDIEINGWHTSGGIKIESISQGSEIQVDISSSLTAMLNTENKEVFETDISNSAKSSQKGLNFMQESNVTNNIHQEFTSILNVENIISNKCSNKIKSSQNISLKNFSAGADGIYVGAISQSSAIKSAMDCITTTTANVLNQTAVNDVLSNAGVVEQAGLLSLSSETINAMSNSIYYYDNSSGIGYYSYGNFASGMLNINGDMIQEEADVQLAQIESARDTELSK